MLGNWTKTFVLMAAITALFGSVGAALGGANGMLMALVFAGGMNIYAYWFSDKAVLKMYGAQEVTPDNTQFRSYYNMVKELAENAQLPMPKVYVIDEQQPNAFATGRNPATVAGAISAIAQFGMFFGRGERANPIVSILIMLLAPMAAALIQMAISRAREYEADKAGAAISKDPKALAAALEKIHNYAHQIPNQTAEMHPETGQMMIINPLSGKSLKGLFSTHPQTEERVRRLLAMANHY